MKLKLPLSLIIALFFLSNNAWAQAWKTYPYTPDGLLTFPADEGYHPGEPVEWWYTIGHVTGQNTGNAYTYMLTYFYYPTITDGFRILNIANDSTGEFYESTSPMNYPVLSEDHLHIEASSLFGQQEYWKTKTDSTGALIPFEYEIKAQSGDGSLDLDLVTQKRPLIVGDSGFFYQGIANYTYYYSQTFMTVSGNFSIGAISEPVSGIGWIDRQWGSFNPNSSEKYEWFSLQLSNGMDINMWNIFTNENTVPQLPTYRILSAYINDSTQITVSDFNLERKAYAYAPDGQNCYAQSWHLTCDTLNLDLNINTLYSNGEVQLPFKFYEGATKITGTIDGVTVIGVGFAELLHNYKKPDVEIISPGLNTMWQDSLLVSWQINNPDEGLNLLYTVKVSYDNGGNFQLIDSGITQNSAYWFPQAQNDSDVIWLKVQAYTPDSTLFGGHHRQVSFHPLSEADFFKQGVFKLYPNPTSDKLFIELGEGKNLSVEIFDLSGRLFFKENKVNAQLKIDTRWWPKGNYVLKTVMGGKTFTKQFAVQ